MPVLTHSVLAQPPLAFGFVFVQELWWQHNRLLELVPRLIVLPRVSLALAGSDHGDFVRSSAAVLALQLDTLGAGLVIDAPPVMVTAPSSPEFPAIRPTDPVFEHLSRETLTRTYQFLDGVDAGAVAVRDVLSGPQLSASDLTPIASLLRRVACSSPTGARAV